MLLSRCFLARLVRCFFLLGLRLHLPIGFAWAPNLGVSPQNARRIPWYCLRIRRAQRLQASPLMYFLQSTRIQRRILWQRKIGTATCLKSRCKESFHKCFYHRTFGARTSSLIGHDRLCTGNTAQELRRAIRLIHGLHVPCKVNVDIVCLERSYLDYEKVASWTQVLVRVF